MLGPATALTVGLLALLVSEPLFVRGEPPFNAFRDFVLFGLTPLCWLSVRRIVTREYDRDTWRVLEALPVRRGTVLTIKLALAAAPPAVGLAGGLGLAAGFTRLAAIVDPVRLSPLPGYLVAQLGLSAGAYLLAVLGALVLLACLGRRRQLVLAVAVAVELVAWRTGVDVRRLAPAQLAGAAFRLGDGAWVAVALESALLGAGGLVGAALLVLVGGRQLVRDWSGPVRPVESGLAAAVAGGVALVALLGYEQPAYWMEGHRLEERGVAVRLPGSPSSPPSPQGEAERQAAQVLARRTSAALDDVARRLGQPLPPLSIELSPALDGATFQRASLRGRRGVLVRIDYLEPGFEADAFLAWLLREVLDAATHGRLRDGPAHLLLDGYPTWWVGSSGETSQDWRERSARRAAWGLEVERGAAGGSARLGSEWAATRARTGDPIACALAGWLLEQVGPGEDSQAAVDRLARAAIQGTLGSRPDRALAGASGRGPEDFRGHVARQGEALLGQQQAVLAAVPRLAPAELGTRWAADGFSREVLFAAGPGPGRFSFLHGEVALGHTEPTPGQSRRDEAELGAAAVAAAWRYPMGTRLAYTFAAWAPELGCDVVTGWRVAVVQ